MNPVSIVAIVGAKPGHGGVPQSIPQATVVAREYYATTAPSGYVVANDLPVLAAVEKADDLSIAGWQILVVLALAACFLFWLRRA